tara:strand:+ start:5620 stop:5922 length:303 start_codon:yes stop_codon:yes gene_type:complete
MTTLKDPDALQHLHPSFQSLLTNPAYLQVVKHFDDLSLQAATLHSSIESYGQAHIRESGIKSVFRLIEACATGDLKEHEDHTPPPLENETLEDDSLSQLD